MKDLLLKKGDETDNIRLNNFNNFVTQLDREDKLAYMFGKAGRDKLLDLKQSISDVMVKEPGAVNYPNTARGLQYKKQLQESLKQPNQLAPKQTNKNALNNKPVKIDLTGMAE
jgi:hypothetical protein